MGDIVKNENYVLIQGYMINDLELKGNDLLVYAIISGFSQGDSCFTGNLNYLANWTNSTKQGVLKNLNNLIDKGLIVKEEETKNNIKYVKYKTGGIKQSLMGYSTEFNGGIKQSLMGYSTEFNGGIKQSLPNNINNNININNNKDDEEILKYYENKIGILYPNQYEMFYNLIDKVGKDKVKEAINTTVSYGKNTLAYVMKVATNKTSYNKKEISSPSWLNEDLYSEEMCQEELEELEKEMEIFK